MMTIAFIAAVFGAGAKLALLFAAAFHCLAYVRLKLKPLRSSPHVTVISKDAMLALTIAAGLWLTGQTIIALGGWIVVGRPCFEHRP